MTEYLPEKPDIFINDLNDFDQTETSIHLSVAAKNINRLSDLNIENLWLVGPNDKELKKILSLVSPRYLNVYQVLAKDLAILEALHNTETIVLEWNTKSELLWDISKNRFLRTLQITDFSKLRDISQIGPATQIESLTLRGGINKKLELSTLKPLSTLNNLKYLELGNLKVKDASLRYLGLLTSLDELAISNQFDIKEYAWLATRLDKTKCDLFNGFRKIDLCDSNNKTVFDTMITGKRKPLLLSTKDKEKIKLYRDEFEMLKQKLAE
jgi:hypothetical protein